MRSHKKPQNVSGGQANEDKTICKQKKETMLQGWKEIKNNIRNESDFWVNVQFSSVQFSSVAQSCLTLGNPMDYSPLGSSVQGILQARILEWLLCPSPGDLPDPGIEPTFLQFSSVTQSCLTLCNPMNCSTPGLPIHHQHPEFTQTHVHRVSDAIQPSHPLSCPSPPIFNLSWHQDLFQWVNSSDEVTKVLEFQP